MSDKKEALVLPFDEIRADDVPLVGGKNASLGEMLGRLKEKGVLVPDGFATTARAYWDFIDHNDLADRIRERVQALKKGDKTLQQTGKSLRQLFLKGEFPEAVAQGIQASYAKLSQRYGHEDTNGHEMGVAVRSSATAEDLPDASFAGQQETFLNVRGEQALLDACRRCYASLFTDRAISYRTEKGFDHLKVALSVGVQKMVRSDKAGAGVMFTIDTETGFPRVIVINAAWGLGENVVQGSVTPDEYLVFKPLLGDPSKRPVIGRTLGAKEKKLVYAEGGTKTVKNLDARKSEREAYVLEDDEVLRLARWAAKIEDHYGRPMDIEWAKDGEENELYIVQARPETVQSNREASTLKAYTLKERSEKLVTGLSIGDAIASGEVCPIADVEHIDDFKDGAILVTEMTDPDWVPIMKRAAGIVTDHGGRTCHAAIVSRELGIPAVVGTGDATGRLEDGRKVTLSCAEGDQGFVYDGFLDFEEEELDLESIPQTKTRIMMNVASPAAAFRWWRLPCEGIGLARMEFIINNLIKIHPMALVQFDRIEDGNVKERIENLTAGFHDKAEYFVENLALGIARIAAAQHPDPVVVRMSDFKTNEYADLIGGRTFEPVEHNPMIGFRGASRYYSERYREGFALECRAVKRVRERIGLDNVIVMIPFCRTLEEADRVLGVLAENGLTRGEKGLQVYVMCEIPSNVILADKFAERFDGFSIGSNDLTQLVLGIDRDSSELAPLFDERNEAVEREIARVIRSAHKAGAKVGICGQAPSDYPEFAAFLVKEGIDSISLNPDSIIRIKKIVAETESGAGTAG